MKFPHKELNETYQYEEAIGSLENKSEFWVIDSSSIKAKKERACSDIFNTRAISSSIKRKIKMTS